MPENMSISVNGQSQVPPGFRFHPTEEELLQYYLRKKVSYEKIDLDVIRDVDLNKLEPWDIQEKCRIGTTPQNDWYFFSHKDKKYPTGTRTNRATAAGFWKATGRDKVIFGNGRRIGMRKTLVFYKGRAPHGQKSDWIMHEYRLDDNTSDTNIGPNVMGDAAQEEGWVVCRIFKKKNHLKTLDSPLASSIDGETRGAHMFDSCEEEGVLEQILQMGRTCKDENETNNNNGRFASRSFDTGMISNNNGYNSYEGFMKLPSLESPKSTSFELESQNQNNGYQPMVQEMGIENEGSYGADPNQLVHQMESLPSSHIATGGGGGGGFITSWAALDRLVASQLNGQTDSSRQLACFNVDPTNMGYCISDPNDLQFTALRSSSSSSSIISSVITSSNGNSNRTAYVSPTQDYTSEIDLWSIARSTSSLLSSSEPACHVSNTSV